MFNRKGYPQKNNWFSDIMVDIHCLDSIFLTFMIAILVNEKAMMGSLNLGVLGLILSFGLFLESFSGKCWLVINNNKVMVFNDKADAENLSKMIKSAKDQL